MVAGADVVCAYSRPRLSTRLFLLVTEERKQGNTGDLDDFEADTWDITNGVTGATESRNEHLVVLLDEVQTTITGYESSDLLAVLDQLHSARLTDSGVGLLRLDSDTL